MSRFTIGILGGMGPRATVYFEQRLLDKLRGPDQSLPKIVPINDGAIPDRTEYLKGAGADPLPALRRNARSLLRLSPDLVCVPCNTAHADQILGRLLADVPLPTVDMPAAALRLVAGHSRVLILGTEGTKLSRVYDRRAREVTITYPDTSTQQTINALIADTKRQGFALRNRDALQRIVNSSQSAVIIACTELSVLNRGLHSEGLV